jgi:UDP-galactopyranose mutase
MMEPTTAAVAHGTVLTRETPFSPSNPGDYEYPFPDLANSNLYRCYRDRARSLAQLLVCGRLGEYRYYDMDQAIARARLLGSRILEGGSAPADE